MARADLLVDLIRAAARGDTVLFRRAVEAMIAEERGKQHHVLADRMTYLLQQNGTPKPAERSVQVADERLHSLFVEQVPKRRLEELVLPEVVHTVCREIVEEQERADILRSHNLEPRNRLLLIGPPGNGKTSLAEALAFSLALPFIRVRYEGVIGSFLGETASRLRRLMDHVRTRRCVLFFDEFDTIGKERGDEHETGEIKRVVSSLLMQIDELPSYVVIVAATNHPELLDRAAWRRFQARVSLPRPGRRELVRWVKSFEERLASPLGPASARLLEELKGLSYAELEEFAQDVMRWRILRRPDDNLRDILSSRVKEWKLRASAAPRTKRADG